MTAVEWLVEQLNQSIGLTKFVDNCDEDYKSEILGIINQAKKMEKQQIIEAHGDKQKTKSNSGSIVTYGYTYTGEMYYNEKFKK